MMKPDVICSSGDSGTKYESIKSRTQTYHKPSASDESPSSCDLFGFYKNRRRHLSPYEIYIQSIKTVLCKNISKLKQCGSKIIRRERRANHIPCPSCYHALKVITPKCAQIADQHKGKAFEYLQCFKNCDELTSIPRRDHKKKHDLLKKNKSIMCHLKGNPKNHHHHPKKKRRVSYSIQKDDFVDVACGNLSIQSIELPVVTTQDLQAMHGSADQSLGLPKLTTQSLAPEQEFLGSSSAKCLPNRECMYTPSPSAMIEKEKTTQTITPIYSCRTSSFSHVLPKPYNKSVQFIANIHMNNLDPDPKSMAKFILICLAVTVWSPILLGFGIVWLLSYPFRLIIVWKRNLQYKRKMVCLCKNRSSCKHRYKAGLTKLQCKMQSSRRQNQKQPNAWRTPCYSRRRDFGRNNSISQYKTIAIKNFYYRFFRSCDKIHQSNVSSFRAKRNMVVLKNNTLKKLNVNDKRTRHSIIESSPRLPQNSQVNKVYPIRDADTTTEPKGNSVNLQTHDDQGKFDNDMYEWSSFFSPFMKLV